MEKQNAANDQSIDRKYTNDEDSTRQSQDIESHASQKIYKQLVEGMQKSSDSIKEGGPQKDTPTPGGNDMLASIAALDQIGTDNDDPNQSRMQSAKED